MPSWKVVNIIKGFWFKLINKNANYKRLDICNACSYKDGKWCGICGCLLDAKTRVSSEHCPKKYW